MNDETRRPGQCDLGIPVRHLLLVVALTIVSGAANAVIIFVVTTALPNPLHASTFVYFTLASFVYLASRKYSETQLMRLTSEVVYRARLQVARHILALPYPEFQSTERGVFYNVIGEDTSTVSSASSVAVTLATSAVTIAVACGYMYVIDPTVALIMTSAVAIISGVYAIRTQQAKRFLDAARQELNNYVGHVNDLLDGFKELRIHAAKMAGFHHDMEASGASCRRSSDDARIRLLNAFLTGESLLLAALGCIAFVIPAVMPERHPDTAMSFAIVLLYLIGPIKAVLTGLPQLVQLQMAWERIGRFLQSSPLPATLIRRGNRENRFSQSVAKLEVCDVGFEYPSVDGRSFAFGPISLIASQGECVFVVGGNGSGKTTLAKIILGLYEPSYGEIRIDGKAVNSAARGEYFSVVFNPCHVFNKFYGIGEAPRPAELRKDLERLGLSDRVEFSDGGIRASKLSAGQRKRVALLESLLQDRPILLFDEFAADQDPEFRRFFYEQLLSDLKSAGKIVIAITHDEQYFRYADRVLKLELDRVVPAHRSCAVVSARVGSFR